jgi:hypothetical protein
MMTSKITSPKRLLTFACLLTAWAMWGCEKEAAVDFNLIYPSAAEPVYLIGKPFTWASSKAGTSTFELMQGQDVIFSQDLTGNTITPQVAMTAGTYTMRVIQGNSSVVLTFTATSADSLLGHPKFGGSMRYIVTDPNGNTNVQYLNDSISVLASPNALQCVVETPWLTSPTLQIEQVTDSLILFDTLFLYDLHSHFRATAEINYLQHKLTCTLRTSELRTSRVVEFSSN